MNPEFNDQQSENPEENLKEQETKLPSLGDVRAMSDDLDAIDDSLRDLNTKTHQ